MADIFEEYKKQNRKKQALLIFSSLFVAFAINAFVSPSSLFDKLQTAVYNAQDASFSGAQMALYSAGSGTDMLVLKNRLPLSQVSQIKLTLAYDGEQLAVKNIFSEKTTDIINLSNVPGISRVIIKFAKPINLATGEKIASFVYSKKTEANVSMNLAEVSFATGTEQYDLTSASLDF